MTACPVPRRSRWQTNLQPGETAASTSSAPSPVTIVISSIPLLQREQPDSSQEEPGESQDGSASQAEIELPEVDVTPNEEGLTIHEKPEGDALAAQEVYNRVVQSTVAITVSRTGEETDSSGTGIIATSDGYIITNAHVVLNTKSVLVTVTTYDGQQYDAVVVGMDRTTDLAVIKTNDYGFTPAQFGDADELSIGEWVLAIGNPGGERFSSSLTRGIISGLDREVGEYSENGMTYIQTDAAINPGNSGGALVDSNGKLIGINTLITSYSGNYSGVGFAIPVNYAVNIAQQIIEGKTPTHAQLGVSLSTVNSQNAKRYGLKVDSGAYISAVNSGSGAAEAGLEEGDIVTKFDGNSVSSASDLMLDVRSKNPGDKVTLEVNRNGDTKQIEVTLGSDESSQSAATQQNSGSSSSEMLNRLLNNSGSSSKNDAA